MSYNNWKCSHGHTKDEHPACFEAYMQAMAPNRKIESFIDFELKKNLLLLKEDAKIPRSNQRNWEPVGVGKLTQSRKMIRLDIFTFEKSPIFVYFWKSDLEDHLGGNRNFRLYKLLTYSERKKENAL